MAPSQVQVDLRPLARARTADGSLPCVVPRQVLAGYGGGAPCDLCGDPIPGSEVEYQIVSSDGRIYRFHTACQDVWETACLPTAKQSEPGSA
jgi:hypothetical protein